MINILFFIFGGIVFSFVGYVLGCLALMGFFEGVRIPVVDRYYEWKEIRENKKYNQELIATHKTIYGEEPVIEWRD